MTIIFLKLNSHLNITYTVLTTRSFVENNVQNLQFALSHLTSLKKTKFLSHLRQRSPKPKTRKHPKTPTPKKKNLPHTKQTHILIPTSQKKKIKKDGEILLLRLFFGGKPEIRDDLMDWREDGRWGWGRGCHICRCSAWLAGSGEESVCKTIENWVSGQIRIPG